jgi:hypothetical protein
MLSPPFFAAVVVPSPRMTVAWLWCTDNGVAAF